MRRAGTADFIISAGDVRMLPGTTAELPVYITGTTAGQTLNLTSFEFQITTAGATQLAFANSPDPGSDPTFSAANYVFAGNSGDVFYGSQLGLAVNTVYANDSFYGGDFTAPPNYTNTVVSTGTYLLGYLPITTATDVPPVTGNSFTVSLIGESSTFQDNSGPYNFTSTPGTVTITPEPGSLILVGLGAVGLLLAAQSPPQGLA